MTTPPKASALTTLGISPSYASMILSNQRTPARGLAIRIFRDFGWKHPVIADLTEKQMKLLEEIEPWSPRKDEAQDVAA